VRPPSFAVLPGFAVLISFSLVLSLGGCGFVAAGRRSHTKPNGFVLQGYVSVIGVPAGAPGSPCQAPPSVPDIVAGGPVRVADTTGAAIATGTLRAGVMPDTSPGPEGFRCNFAFEIRDVSGAQQVYVIVVGTRPAASFDGENLRANQAAVIDVHASA
jgi:hypothetical protein